MIKDMVLDFVTNYGYYALFITLVLGIVGIPLPDEILMTYCGYLVSAGVLTFSGTMLTAVAGSITGITLSYWAGRRFGQPLVERFGRRFGLTPERLDKVHAWYARFGKFVLIVGYFVPGIRHVTALTAGMGKMPFLAFAVYAYAGAVIWSLTFVGLGNALGVHWTRVTEMTHDVMFWVVTPLFLVAFIWGIIIWRKRRKRIT